MTQPVYSSSAAPALGSGHQPTNLADILERVLDRGLVICGDIQVNLLDIELLTIKLRLLIASVDTARQLGINWWETDPWLTGGDRKAVEGAGRERPAVGPAEDRHEVGPAEERRAVGPAEDRYPATSRRDERSAVRDR